MTHLTPEEMEAVEDFRSMAKARQAESRELLYRNCLVDSAAYSAAAHRYTLAADAIEQRAALAGQVVVLRDALEEIRLRIIQYPPRTDSLAHAQFLDEGLAQGKSALALSIPQAAAQVAEWKEKAELLEWLESSGASYSLEEFGWEVTVGDTTHGPNPTLIGALRAAKEQG